MFRQALNAIPPFNKFRDDEVQGLDKTLTMTANVLLSPRVENFRLQSVFVRNGICGMDFEAISTDPKVYSFYWFETSDNPDAKLDEVKAKFETIVSAPNIEKFIKDRFGQTVYIRIMPKENTVCLFVEKLSIEMWHLLQSFISKYFDIFKKKPLNEDELEFARSLTLKTSGNYLSRLQVLADSEYFRKLALEMQLNGFEKRLFERKTRTAREEVASCQRSIDNLMSQLRDMTRKHLEAKIYLEGLSQMTAGMEERTELQEYLLNNKCLADISVEDSNIKFVVKTFIIPYNTEDWENMSRRGSIFEGIQGYTEEEAKLLLDAVFSEDHLLKLKVCAHVDLDYLYCNVRSNTGYDYSRFRDYVPNAHLRKHSCFGQNGPDIVAQLQRGDVIGAIECAINSVRHMNVNELTASFIPFVRDVMKCTGKCFVAEDGTEMTPREAIDFLKGKNNESNPTE